MAVRLGAAGRGASRAVLAGELHNALAVAACSPRRRSATGGRCCAPTSTPGRYADRGLRAAAA